MRRKPQKQETASALAPPAAQLCYCSLVSAMLSSRCPRVLTPAVPRRPFIMSHGQNQQDSFSCFTDNLPDIIQGV